MRVVYLNKVYVDSTLPAVNFSFFNAYALAQAGAESILVAQKKDRVFDEYTLYSQFNLSPIDNFTILIFPQKRYLGIKTNQWFYLQALRDIHKLHKQQKIDVLISRDPGALPYMVRLKRKTSISIIYQPHNFYVDLSLRPDVNPKNARKYQFLEKKYIPKLDGVLCLQGAQAQWFRKYFTEQNISVAKPGLIHIKKVNKNRFHKKLIGYIGSLQSQKGVDILLEAFILLAKQSFSLLFIGGRNEEEVLAIEKKIDKLKLAESVRVTGWIPFHEVESYLDSISVGILPLKETFYNQYLTAPNKIFDYLSRGIPIVASDLPAIREFLNNDEDSIFFNPQSAQSLANAILKLFSSEHNYAKFCDNALRAADAFLWKSRAQIMLEEIDKIKKVGNN